MEPKTCTVIGAGNIIGRSLVHRILKLGDYKVRIADSTQLQLDHYVTSHRLTFVTLDITNKSQIIKAIEGSSVVFYLQSTASSTDDFYTSYTLIVQGTKNVINACRECKVKRLIYSSSTDVVSNWLHDIDNGDESLPYATKFDVLSDLKAQADALVLIANDIDGLLTCALRPCNVFGPGDMKIIPFLVKGAKFGLAKFILGSGQNKSDFIYVENVAHALMCADEALSSRMVSVAGKAFFITNFEPIKFWELVSCILEGLGYQRPTIKLPVMLTRNIVLLVKWIHWKLDSSKLYHFTPVDYFVELALCTKTFNCSASHEQIGYSPVVSLQEGIALTLESFSSLRIENTSLKHGDCDEPSSVEQLLGNGIVADIFLWRDEKKTFTCFLSLVALCYWILTTEGTFVSSSAKLLLLVTTILFGYSLLPSKVFGFTLQRIPLNCFNISEVDMVDLVSVVTNKWNGVVSVVRKLAQGEDWSLFFKVALSLYVMEFVLSHFLIAAIGVGLTLAFTLFFVYDQYEEQIGVIARFLFDITKEALCLLKNNLLIFAPLFLYNPRVARDKRQSLEKD